MFRPNRPPRFGRRPAQRPLAQLALQALNQAHRLMAAGQFPQAAERFSQLSQGAQRLGRLQQAANLQAQAGLAWAEAGQAEPALSAGRAALQAFLALNMRPRFQGYLANLSATLRARGLVTAADQLEAEFSSHLSPRPTTPAEQPAALSRARLPSVCPQCGAPVRSDEVEWIDEYSAECAFCGAVIQGS